MTNQDILDRVEEALNGVDLSLRQKEMVLDAVWGVLSDNRDEEEGNNA